MNTLTTTHHVKRLTWATGLCGLVGVMLGALTAPAVINWYAYLHKPAFAPPYWFFAPVWVLLHVLMGIALHRTLASSHQRSPAYRHSVALFWVQLTLHTLWAIAFFGLKSPALGLVMLLGLCGSLCLWVMHLQQVHRRSAYLQVPYLLWCCFILVLNYYILRLH